MARLRGLVANVLLAAASTAVAIWARDARRPLLPYYDFDSHWNRLGRKIAGEQVDGFPRRQGWDCAR